MLKRRALFLLLPAAVGLLAGCRRPRQSPEAEVRAAIAALEAAVEDKDLGAVEKLVSERFSFGAGEVSDRPDAMGLLRAVLTRYPHVHLLTHVVALELEPPARAGVRVVVAAAGLPITGAADLARVSADILIFDLVLVNEAPSLWRVFNAAWRPGEPKDFLGDN